MFSVLVLEHFPRPDEFQDRKVRRDRWFHLKASYEPIGLSIDIQEPALDVDGEKLGGRFSDKDGKLFPVEGYQLVFVHQSDNDGYVTEASSRMLPVICYGGAGEELEIGRLRSLIIDFLPLLYLESNINKFFDKVALDQEVTLEALNILIGFDPALEARLELLHMCLTAEGANHVKTNFSSELEPERIKFWMASLVSLCPSLEMEVASAPYRNLTVKKLVEKMSLAGDCFSDEYLLMLDYLKKALLPEK
jgi:hypothetical protein